MINSPYNFVPLSKHVFMPDWSQIVSMDIPFSDGYSGSIDIEVENVAPVYIRNGGNHPEKQDEKHESRDYQEFFQVTPNGSYAIPGTSLKGVIRNVLEIASFGRITADDHRYGVRDLRNQEVYTSHFTHNVGGAFEATVDAGWLAEENEGWVLYPCDFAKIDHRNINQHLQLNLGRERESGCRKTLRYERSPEHAKVRFIIGQPARHNHGKGNFFYRKAEISFNPKDQAGVLVLTGQPSTGPKAKHMEFVFFNDSKTPIKITDKTRKDFEFIHSSDTGVPNEEWDFWRKRLRNGQRVPVFYKGTKTSIDSMGLAMMFRLPYKHSIHEAIGNTSPDHIKRNCPDLAETIFGYVDDKDALRGRVQFETLEMSGSQKSGETVRAVLNGPKPTFYPNYLEQAGDQLRGTLLKNRYQTFMDDDCRIRGWKRYPIRKGVTVNPGTRNVETCFKPMPVGCKFKGRVNLHNLRPTELGALLWCLTFGGNNAALHSLGMAKPLGYGAVKISVTGAEIVSSNGKAVAWDKEKDAFINAYRNLMTQFLKAKDAKSPDWEKTDQIIHLVEMAMKTHKHLKEENFKYPRLGSGRGANEFINAKEDKAFLQAAEARQDVLTFAKTSFESAFAQPGRPAGGGNQGRGYGGNNGGRSAPQGNNRSFTPAPKPVKTGYGNGDVVTCVVMEEKTKKGAWRFKIEHGGPTDFGTLHPSSPTPEGIEAGKTYKMKIFAFSPGNCIFKTV